MTDLPARPDLDQLRNRAKDLLAAAKHGDPEALERIRTVSDRLTLASAQLAVARDHGFASWPKLKAEVDRRELLNQRDLTKLAALIHEDPTQAVTKLEHFCDHRGGVTPLSYMAMLRFDSGRLGLTGEIRGTGKVAKMLLAAGAPVEGDPGDRETPLITAASYGDAEVAKALIEAGADIEAIAAPNAGGVPGGTPLLHAAVFGMTDVVDVLVDAGARVDSLEMAAAAGDISAWPLARLTRESRIRALIFAADHQRLKVIDQLVDAGTPIDAVDAEWGRQALCVAAAGARVESVRHLLARGADRTVRDGNKRRTPLEWCDSAEHDEVRAILESVTTG
jgi:uncharacterized protein